MAERVTTSLAGRPRVEELLRQGVGSAAIVEEVGCSASYVRSALFRLRQAGAIPAAPARRAPVGTPRPIAERLGPDDALVEFDGGEITVERAHRSALIAVHERGRIAAVVRGDRADLTDLIEALTAARDALPVGDDDV